MRFKQQITFRNLIDAIQATNHLPQSPLLDFHIAVQPVPDYLTASDTNMNGYPSLALDRPNHLGPAGSNQ
jgi:hypothetical protein